jgi:hypothetical protein
MLVCCDVSRVSALSSVGDHDVKFMEMRGGSFDDVFQHIRLSLQMRQQTVIGMAGP